MLMMPYYIYIITPGVSSTARTTDYVAEFDSFKAAKKEARRLRAEEELEGDQAYKIIFAQDRHEAVERLKEFREETIVREWEK
jgi:CBS domain containing-hemolysin-like protein